MNPTSRKLQFALDVEGDWPPVSSESVWCDPVGSAFRLRNAPFFIKDLAVDDVFRADPDPANGHIFDFEVIEPSTHSLVWILNNTHSDVDPVLAQLRALGCSTEGLEAFSLYSIDIPPEISEADLDVVLDQAVEAGFHLAFPVWRRT